MKQVRLLLNSVGVRALIVLVVLGAAANILVPWYAGASGRLKHDQVLAQLKSVREQLQVYAADHKGRLPRTEQMWGALTGRTDRDGVPRESGTPGPYFGPYLSQPPTNPFTGSSDVADATLAGGGAGVPGVPGVPGELSAGWLYNPTTGAIVAYAPAYLAATLGLTTNDVVGY